MTNPPPNFKPGVGRLATDRYDFESHLEGHNPPGFTNFRHTADQTDMNPPVIGGATTVQDSFENVASFIAAQSGVGQGFITVGDGYDTWHLANGTNNFDPSVPSLDTLLNPIFSAILSNTALPANYARIQRGGIVVIKAGTYIVKHSIIVPPSITLIGEGYGTKIVNATNLNTSVTPPIINTPIEISNITGTSPLTVTTATPLPTTLVTGDTVNISAANGPVVSNPAFPGTINSTWQITVTGSNTLTLNNSSATSGSFSGTAFLSTMSPVFRIAADNNRAVNDAAVDSNLFVFSRETKIMNMIIADNFVENTQLGDFNYLVSQNVTSSTFSSPPPLISQSLGSSLILDQVILMGRASYVSGVVSKATGEAIALDATNPAPNGTIIRVTNSTMDGFSIPIVWLNTAGGADYLEVSNCKIRGYGYYDGLGAGNPGSNNIITINDCTAKVTNNTIYANSNNMSGAVAINLHVATAPNLQARGKILVAMNNFIVDKYFSGSTATVLFDPILNLTGVSNTYISWMSYGNNLQDGFNVAVDGTESAHNNLAVTSGGVSVSSLTGLTLPTPIVGFFNVPSGIFNAIQFSAGSSLILNGKIFNNVATVTSSSYTMDSGGTVNDYAIIVNPSSGGSSIHLAPVTATLINNVGRTIFIKAGPSISGTNPVTIIPNGANTIDGSNSSIQLTIPYSSITLFCGSATSPGLWYII